MNLIQQRSDILVFENAHLVAELNLKQGGRILTLRPAVGGENLIEGLAHQLQVSRQTVNLNDGEGRVYRVSAPSALQRDGVTVGQQITVEFDVPLLAEGTLTIKRLYTLYADAGALRWVDTWHTDRSLHGLRYSDLISVKLLHAGGAKVVDFFTCSDQSNERVSCKDAEAENVAGLFTHDGNAGIFCYREGPCPDSQPVPTDFDFAYDKTQQQVSMVGLGFDRLHPGAPRRANGVVIGVLENAESLRGLKRYQLSRYPLQNTERIEYLTNSWPAYFLKIDETKILDELDAAAESGMDTVYIDDGWFDIFMGDVDLERFPRGFAPIAERAKDLGLQVGLWMNPLGLDSRHPEAKIWDGAEGHDTNIEGNPWNWVARSTNYTPVEKIFSEGTRIYVGMDLLNPGYAAHIRKKVIDLYTQFGFKRFKFDLYQQNEYNTLLGDVHEHFEAYRALLEDLKQEIPELMISMDVTRTNRPGFDFAMDYGRLFLENRGRRLKDHRYYQPYTALGNLWRLAKYMPAHRCELEMMPQVEEYPLEYIVGTTLFAHPLYWGSQTDMGKEKRKHLKAFKETLAPHKERILNQWVFPFGDAPGLNTWSGLLSVDPDLNRGYVAVYRNGGDEGAHVFRLPQEAGEHALQNVFKPEETVQNKEGFAEFEIPEPFGFRLYAFNEG
ncbi:alpha-galactosidase [Kiritimatiellaeota bacterium B1221]|nr:alpha-galactosidase [Kiritimatiellaeota bacterium B1221]